MSRTELIGYKIKNLRERHNITQDELAEYLGVTRQTLIRWEKGISEPSLSYLYEISAYFNINLSDIVDDKLLENVKTNTRSKIIFGDKFLLKASLILSYEFLFIFVVVGICILTYSYDSYTFKEILWIFIVFFALLLLISLFLTILVIKNYIRKKNDEKDETISKSNN